MRTNLKMENELLRDLLRSTGSEAKSKIRSDLTAQERKSISVMCCFFQVSRSGYYGFVHRLGRPEKGAAIAGIIAEQREHSFRTYGYRRMWQMPEKRGIHRNPKTILRIMEKYGLRRMKMGQYGAAYA